MDDGKCKADFFVILCDSLCPLVLRFSEFNLQQEAVHFATSNMGKRVSSDIGHVTASVMEPQSIAVVKRSSKCPARH